VVTWWNVLLIAAAPISVVTGVLIYAINKAVKPMATNEKVAELAGEVRVLSERIDGHTQRLEEKIEWQTLRFEEKFDALLRHMDDRFDSLEKRLERGE
jgi:hypothetical protein